VKPHYPKIASSADTKLLDDVKERLARQFAIQGVPRGGGGEGRGHENVEAVQVVKYMVEYLTEMQLLPVVLLARLLL
jgi:hypothetical protein